jgi:hypothetical protein
VHRDGVGLLGALEDGQQHDQLELGEGGHGPPFYLH